MKRQQLVNVHVTQHAITQFHRHWAPNKTRERAQQELQGLLTTSEPIQQTDRYTIRASRYGVPAPLVLANKICVTVLPPNQDEPAPLEWQRARAELEQTYRHAQQELQHLEHQLNVIDGLLVQDKHRQNEIKTRQRELRMQLPAPGTLR